MKYTDINTDLAKTVVLDLLEAAPQGVRTTVVAHDPRMEREHQAQTQENVGTYRQLVGRTLGTLAEIKPERSAPNSTGDMLWLRA